MLLGYSTSSAFPCYISGVHPFWMRFLFTMIFFFFSKSNHWGSHIPSSWMVHAGCVFVAAFTHLGYECQDLLSLSNGMHVCTDKNSVYILIRKSLGGGGGGGGGGGNGVRTQVNSNGKIPSTGNIFLRGGSNPQRCIKQDCEPNTLPTSYSDPDIV